MPLPRRSRSINLCVLGMPRRIRPDFATLQSGCCDICGAESDELLGFMTVKNYGVNYDGWRHPLTPYRAR